MIDGLLMTLHFDYSGGSCDLDFVNGCEVSSYGPPPLNIPTTFIDGSAGPMPRTDYFVDAAATGSGDGLSWANAFTTITAAASAALDRGAHVTIKPGTYNEALVITSNGLELVPVTTGVSVTGTNTIIFPSGTSLDCIDPASYPDEIFLYLYRSMKGNNGVYEVLDIDPDTRMATVRGADFTVESGTVGDTASLQAAIAHAIVYRKDTTDTDPVIVSAAGISNARAVCYIGTPADATGETVTAAANYNIIDGLELTGISSSNARGFGLRIQGSSANVFMNGKIYECDSVGAYIHGVDAFPAKRNIIAGNTIYNLKRKGLKIGKEGQTLANNRAHHNHFLRNEVYSTGTGTNPGFYTMAETNQYTSHNVIENNTFRNFSFLVGGKGTVLIGFNSRYNLVMGNYLKDITDNSTSFTNAYIYVRHYATGTKVFNNVLLKSTAINDDIFAFRLNGANHNGSHVVYNTVFRLDKGIRFEDNSTVVPNFQVRNNIFSQIADVYFTHAGTGGQFSVGYNCYEQFPTQSGGPFYFPDLTSKVADPLFFNTSFFGSPYGFTVKAGSQCLAGGTPITGIAVDYRNHARNATSPTIGAFEEVLTETNWTGEVSSDWHDYRNWSPDIVPNQFLEAIIVDRENDPIIFNSNASCKGIDIQPGVNMIVNSPLILTVYE